MHRKIIYFIFVIVAGSTINTGTVRGDYSVINTPDEIVEGQYKPPRRSSNRYFDNNKLKRKFRAKRKVGGTWDCHVFTYYKSKPQKEREKHIKKNRKRL